MDVTDVNTTKNNKPKHNIEDYEPGANKPQVFRALRKVAKAKPCSKPIAPHVQA
jgi:hypothetical protein